MPASVSSASPPADVLGLAGSTIDQIRFDACIDAGGFGIIYRGFHLGLREPVAIKCLRLSHVKMNLVGKETAEENERRNAIVGRFHDETKLLYHLAQGNLDIPRCISSGEVFAPQTGERVPYMVLEWLEGRTLAADLEDRKARGLPGRSLAEALDLLEAAAMALAYAHGQGVVHRDIKPGNIFIAQTRQGLRSKVLDFGVAKILSDESLGFSQSVQTADGVHLVSPAYAAPEQFSRLGGRIGPWTDVYSLTLVLLEVMLGDKVRGAQGNPTTSPKASSLGLVVSSQVEELLHRAVAANPLERPANAGAFWSALRELAKHSIRPNDANANPLAATAYDGDVAAAMLKVRAATAPAGMDTAPTANAEVKDASGLTPGGGAVVRQNVPPTINDPNAAAPVPAPSAAQRPVPQPFSSPSPFQGTMVMVNAPGAGLRAFQPTIAQKEEAPHPSPPQHGHDASPQSPPMPPISPNAVTAGIVVPSPLAASLGPGIASPVALPPSSQLPQIIGAISSPAPQSQLGQESVKAPHSPPLQRPPTPQPISQQQQQQQHQVRAGSIPPQHGLMPGQLPQEPRSQLGAQQQAVAQQPIPTVPPNLNAHHLGPGIVPTQKPRGNGLVIGILVFVLGAIILVATYVLLTRR